MKIYRRYIKTVLVIAHTPGRPLFAGVVLALFLLPLAGHAQGAPQKSAYRQLLDSYCVSCHNSVLKTANLQLDQADIDQVSKDPQLWERVAMKLGLRAMPPVGISHRPSESEYQGLVSYLQSELDHYASQNPNPGYVTVHRLNRTEYSNAIRDLLALDINTDEFLPADNIGQGFDNIAEVLALSPLLMEQYMFAAGRISRMALGPDEMLPVGVSYSISDSYRQTSRMSEDLPFGSRGGMAFKHYFPMDGEYTLGIKLHRNQEGYIRGIRNKHTLDIRLDDNLLNRLDVGGRLIARPGPLFTGSQNPHYSGDPEQTGYEFTADDELQVRFSADAGSHQVGVSFIENRARPTGILTPRLMLTDIEAYKGGKPAVASVTITGPFEAEGPGQTASREKVFVCQASRGDEDDSCARRVLSRLARQAYRRPLNDLDMQDLLTLYHQGQQQGGFKGGIALALQGILTGPEFLFRVEQDPADVVPGAIYPVSDIELASRLSFFLWSSLPDEELLALAASGDLAHEETLKNQVQRMLMDPRAAALISGFGEQWLLLRNMDIAQPHPNIFPEFDDELRAALKAETRHWFGEMFREDRSIIELLTSDFTYLNERLARHYGIDGVTGSRFRRVSVADRAERRGLLGKGSLLTVTSYNNRTSPVLRGKWVLENLLDMPPPPPRRMSQRWRLRAMMASH